MDKKIQAITNNEQTDIIGFEVGGKYYKRNKDETLTSFFNRVAKKARKKGIDFKANYNKENVQSVPKQKYKSISTASNSIKNKLNTRIKLTAASIIATSILLTGTILGCTNKKAEGTETGKTDKQIVETNVTNYTDNQELNQVLSALAETEEGEQIVSQLKEVYNYQKSENSRLMKYKDADGNILFYESREILAIQDFSNAENRNMMALDYNETRICDYLDASVVAIRAMYVTGRSNSENTLIKDTEVQNKMRSQEEFAEKVMAGKKTTKEINAHFEELMKTGLTYSAVGVNTAYLGAADNITIYDRSQSKNLAQFIKYVTTNNKGINTLQDMCVAKTNTEGLTEEQYDLIAEALEIMDKTNIKVEKESRDKFDASTTTKGKNISKANGTIGVKGSSSLGSTSTQSSFSQTIQSKISKSEAINRFGSGTVKKAEQEANKNTYVDTNNDGKVDTNITEANKKEEEKREELETEATSYENDYAQGRADGYAGNNPSKNTPGYNAGYANGQYQREAEQEEDIIIEEEIIYNQPAVPEEPEQTQEPATYQSETPVQQEEPEVKKVTQVESEGVVYEISEPEQTNVRSYGVQ